MQFILTTFIFSFLLFFLWDMNLPMLASIKETWLWNKDGAFGTSTPNVGENPLSVLNGYRIDSKYYSFSTGKFVNYEEPMKVDFALLNKGYIEFQKIGDEVNFFSSSGELFWKKPINSYPRSGYFGSPVLYLAGDNNTVFLLDTSGNPLGTGELNGRFLTDYDFDQTGKGAVILFSGGEIDRVDDKGILVYHKDLSENRVTSFFKSVTLSPNGKNVLVHFSVGSKDFLMILDETGKIQEEWELEGFYPHKVYFALSDSGRSLLNLPDKVLFFEGDTLIWQEKKEKLGSTYQAVYAKSNVFIYQKDKDIVFLNDKGKIIRIKTLTTSENPIRFFPGKESDTFYLETKKDIYQLRIF
ncbi:MAG: hypothetical protein O9264_18290 [Leptospira sp.]|nr:hypothetical protein [Leptospira sp.]